LLITVSYAISRIYIYNSEIFSIVKEHLKNDKNVILYFQGTDELEFSIVNYNIRTSSAFGNAEFNLLVGNSEKSLSAHVQLKKNTNWKVTSVELGGLNDTR
jgi:hypothetical protein